MNRSTYLADPYVRHFIDWATHFVTGEWGLEQSWTSKKLGAFSCDSLFGAYSNYRWDGKDFEQTTAFLDACKSTIRSITSCNLPTDDAKRNFLNVAVSVVEWGGIYNNRRLPDMCENALDQLKSHANLLHPLTADTNNLIGFKYMNASFSKIYSIMIDGFPMYDSRVACALTSLIWLFCKESSLPEAPQNLRLGVPNPKGDRIDRNPQRENFRFPNIQGAQDSLHARCNLKAAWLLGELAQKGKFAALPRERRVDALQSALFMIGYEPLKPEAIKKPHPES